MLCEFRYKKITLNSPKVTVLEVEFKPIIPKTVAMNLPRTRTVIFKADEIVELDKLTKTITIYFDTYKKRFLEFNKSRLANKKKIAYIKPNDRQTKPR